MKTLSLVLTAAMLGSAAGVQVQAQERTTNTQKKGFWIFSFEKKPVPPKDEMRERLHSMEKLRIFDYVTVFQLETEMKAYAEEAYALKNRFTEREQLIVQERLSLMDELDALIQEQKAGKDRKSEILRAYKKLYVNTKKMHELGQEHAQDLQKLSQHIYKEYLTKTESRLGAFEDNPQELVDILIKSYNQTGGVRH